LPPSARFVTMRAHAEWEQADDLLDTWRAVAK
jgi:hypothetical protein